MANNNDNISRALYAVLLMIAIFAATSYVTNTLCKRDGESLSRITESVLVRKPYMFVKSLFGGNGISEGDSWMYGNTTFDEKYIYAVEATNLLAEIETLNYDLNSPSVQRWLLRCKYLQEELKAGDKDDARLLSLMEVAERSVTGKGDYFSLKELDDYFSIYGFEYKYYSLNELEQGIRKYVNQRRSQ